jgi:hypothetical protein
LISNLILKRDKDWLHVGIGGEGSGKSTLGWNSCQFVANQLGTPFSNDNVVFTLAELQEALLTLPNRSVIMFDEAEGVLYSRDAMSRNVKWLNKKLMSMRALNHFMWLNIPDLFSLDIYVRKFRVKSLTECFEKELYTGLKLDMGYGVEIEEILTELGYFNIYDKHSINRIHKDRKTGREIWTRPNDWDTFDAIDMNDKEYILYLKRKDAYIKNDGVAKDD